MIEHLVIRRAALSDLSHIQRICIKTGASGQDASGLLQHEELLSLIYAEPYLHYDLRTCFVVCSDDGVLGYILGALNTDQFNQWMNNVWLPALKPNYRLDVTETKLDASLTQTIHKGVRTPDLVNEYPSHLHVDLLPSVQGVGMGRKLMQTLLDQLRLLGSAGVHLGVGTKNKQAIEFYHHIGFRTLSTSADALILGLKFSDF